MYTNACNSCGSLFSTHFETDKKCPRCQSKTTDPIIKVALIGAAVIASLLFALSPGVLISILISFILMRVGVTFFSGDIVIITAAFISIAIYGRIYYKKKDWKKASVQYLKISGVCAAVAVTAVVTLPKVEYKAQPIQSASKSAVDNGASVPKLPEPAAPPVVAVINSPVVTESVVKEQEQAALIPVPVVSAPVAPGNATGASALQIANGFTVLAPDESKSALTSMLANASSALKLAELKGTVEALQKPASGDRRAARALNEKGLQALKQSQLGEAVSLLQQGVTADPADVEIRNNYVYALLKSKNYLEAEKEAGISLTQSPGRSSAWANLAEIYAGKGNIQESAMALIVAFQFSSNKDRTLTFLKENSTNAENTQMQESSKLALKRLENM